MKTKNKLIIMITGASDGLGRELAIQLAKKGHDVFACTRYSHKIKVFLKKKNLFLIVKQSFPPLSPQAKGRE